MYDNCIYQRKYIDIENFELVQRTVSIRTTNIQIQKILQKVVISSRMIKGGFGFRGTFKAFHIK